MKRVLVFFVLCALLSMTPVQPAVAAMNSTNFQIPWDTVADGGSDTSTSTNYGLRDTLGNQAAGTSTSANFGLAAGYRVGDTGPVLSLIVRSQEPSTQVSWTAFSDGGNTVTLTSATAYSVGDYVSVVENSGFSQLTAVGRVTSKVGLVLTVDDWSGDNATISAVPAGGNDYTYRLSSNAAAFGTVTSTAENTSVAMTSVRSDAPNGFSLYTQANQILQNGSAQAMAIVTDGAVTAGVEEYGASVTGPNAVGAGDQGVTTTQRLIQQSGAPVLTPDRVAMTYKLSIVPATNSGAYSQSVFYTLTANY